MISLRSFIEPEFVADGLGAIFVIILYKGLTLEMKEKD